MAENNPNAPGGAVPPKPAEAAKVQPKKETVRISLPPKPASSPTIKLPTLPAGGPAAPAAAAPTGPGVVSPPSGGPAPARPPTAAAAAAPSARPPTSTGSAVPRPGAPSGPAPALRPAASSAARKLSGIDLGLGIAAAVVAVGAVVSIVLLLSLK